MYDEPNEIDYDEWRQQEIDDEVDADESGHKS